ncbi:MAG: hypothetical protein SFU56_01180 [Capsulimonadales bacterium]|nr:hypothetical protein [Capsulimonadales bacterium]
MFQHIVHRSLPCRAVLLCGLAMLLAPGAVFAQTGRRIPSKSERTKNVPAGVSPDRPKSPGVAQKDTLPKSVLTAARYLAQRYPVVAASLPSDLRASDGTTTVVESEAEAIEILKTQLRSATIAPEIDEEGACVFPIDHAPKPYPSAAALEMAREEDSLRPVNDLLASFSPDQLAELRKNGFSMDAERIDDNQKALLSRLTHKGIDSFPFYGVPGARLTLRFQYYLQVFSPDGTSTMAEVLNSVAASRKRGNVPPINRPVNPTTVDETPPPEARPRPEPVLPGDDTPVVLPARTSPVYTVRELTALCGKALRQEWYADWQIGDRKVLLLTGRNSLSTRQLAEILRRSYRLHWRVVGPIRFLAKYDLDSVRRAEQDAMERLRRYRTAIIGFLGRHAPDFDTIGPLMQDTPWKELDPGLRSRLLDLANGASGPEGVALRTLMNDPSKMQGAQIRAPLLVDIVYAAGNKSGGAAYDIQF